MEVSQIKLIHDQQQTSKYIHHTLDIVHRSTPTTGQRGVSSIKTETKRGIYLPN